MKNLRQIVLTFALLAVTTASAEGQQKLTREAYILKYKPLAVEQMDIYGIPASIKLAQALFESDNGNSRLAREANNHFGIKCKSDWTGRRVFHDDDARGECFRAYGSVEASYEDHARFLDSQPRYDSLFVYPADDYRSWARGLKAAGYATAPDYAQRLCRIIEETQLYLLDRPQGEALYAARNRSRAEQAVEGFEAGSSVNPLTPANEERIDPDDFRVTINAYKGYNIYVTNGVNYIVAKEGDTFESLAEIFCISARNLRKFNDLKGKAQPVRGEQIYIDRKQKRWEGNAHTHTCRQGETAYAVGQSYAIRTRSIEKLNKLRPGDTLEQGRQIRIK